MKTLEEHITKLDYNYEKLSERQKEVFKCFYESGDKVLIEYHLRYNSTPKIEIDEEGKMIKKDYRQKKRFNNNDYIKTGNNLK